MSALISSVSNIKAQVALTSIVEHFTNTSCSVCNSNNPGIYNNINSNPGVLHISFHPSAPYVSDIFNQQNKTENDNRTQFYGIFGSTPRTVLNGTPISYSSLGKALPPLSSQTSNYLLTINQVKIFQADSFNVEVKIKKVASDPLQNALLFIGVSEDIVTQTTNNGEANHFNVFRKSLTSITGNNITLPGQVGDSILFNFAYKAGTNWQVNKLHTIGILQQSNKLLINSVKSVNTNNNVVGVEAFDKPQLVDLAYPNPTTGALYTLRPISELNVYESIGKLVSTRRDLKKGEIIDLSNIQKGIYYLVYFEGNQRNVQKVMVQ
ncbi:MAG: T9SS C-terminal target domain-containing protein [Cytophagales bacterium]|nr:MAG: T9SS C-terminal target domain-containing protein [Cytophagales bacterium]